MLDFTKDFNVGSLSNDDGDDGNDNESAKKQWVKGLFTWRWGTLYM